MGAGVIRITNKDDPERRTLAIPATENQGVDVSVNVTWPAPECDAVTE